ncbi:hypothetical protein AG1IA_06790 [Rhizoctonia solani AG-1 IA]|uniref:Uncharacterized protein n=1 Tax=Thanatephorus cucumeris (strain AG1-IA) TaxID=983506 RepID=L8WS28_THACA|nr:hypothetical protein AG1IA_06790 [Rhizoctonia solani AG-1 IA]
MKVNPWGRGTGMPIRVRCIRVWLGPMVRMALHNPGHGGVRICMRMVMYKPCNRLPSIKSACATNGFSDRATHPAE